LFILGPRSLLNEHVLNLNNTGTYCGAIEPGTAFDVSTPKFLRLMNEDFGFQE